MSWNPPELKHEMQDTLFCIGLEYEYESMKTDKGLVRSFHLVKSDEYIDIYSQRFIRYAKKRYNSLYDLKLHLLQKFSHLI